LGTTPINFNYIAMNSYYSLQMAIGLYT